MSNDKEFDESVKKLKRSMKGLYLCLEKSIANDVNERINLVMNGYQKIIGKKDAEIELLKKELRFLTTEKEDALLWIVENRKWDLFSNRIHEVDLKNKEIEQLKNCIIRVIDNQCENCNLDETILMCEQALSEVESERISKRIPN